MNFNCNVADVAVTVGAVMLVLALLFFDKDSLVRSLLHRKKEKQEVLGAAAVLDQGAAETDNDIGSPDAGKTAGGAGEEGPPSESGKGA